MKPTMRYVPGVGWDAPENHEHRAMYVLPALATVDVVRPLGRGLMAAAALAGASTAAHFVMRFDGDHPVDTVVVRLPSGSRQAWAVREGQTVCVRAGTDRVLSAIDLAGVVARAVWFGGEG